MKRILLSVFIVASGLSFAQTAVDENFENYVLGNIGTDITGVSAGQYQWLTSSDNGVAPNTTTNAANSNFQIANVGGVNNNVLQITGPNGDNGIRIMTREGLPGFWALRTTGNNILELEFDLFTGPVSTSSNTQRVFVYDATSAKILTGISFTMNTKVISGVGYYDNSAATGGTIANYLFNFGTGTPNTIVLPPNTWVRVGISFNHATGEVRWKGPGFNSFVAGAAAGVDPEYARLLVFSGSTPTVPNTSAAVCSFDNLIMRAVATDGLLEVKAPALASEFSVYPNPVNNVLTIDNAKALSNVSLTDLNGRTVKAQKFNGEIQVTMDVSKLSSGVYLMTIENDGIKSTRKIIKN